MNQDQGAPEKRFLDAIDYTIFIGMLVISITIGLYFAFVNKKKPNTTSEYLTGNKELSVFPIAMSLSSSQISGLVFLMQPAEVYMYGSQIIMIAFSAVLAIIILLYAFLPVFCSLNILSSYQYLKQRFNYKIGMLASVLYLIKTLVSSGAVIYAPAIALSQLSGLNVEISIPILSVICIFYTSIGGLRAVVWADTLQSFFMLFGALALAILGTYYVGGFKNVWERNENTGRIEIFNFDPDPRSRSTFWTVFIGNLFFGLSEVTGNQMVVQRCLALSTFKKIKMTIMLFSLFVFTIFALNIFNGLVAFAVFYDCDPITTKAVSKVDQIIPYLWMFLTQEIPALPGLFVSALFSASFSTISTNLNCMSGVFVIDIIKPLFKNPITEAKATSLMRLMVVIFGGLMLCLAFSINNLEGLYQTVMGFLSIIQGPTLGMFMLGMLCPRVGAKTVLIATLVSFSLVAWISIGTQIAISRNQIVNPKKKFSIEGCDNSTLEFYYSSFNQTKNNFTTDRNEIFPLYAISFHYYTLIGTLITLIVGFLASCFTCGMDKRRSNINLYSPMIRKWITTKCEEAEEMRLNNAD